MRSIIVIACLALPLCVEPAMAQTVHPLTVSVHEELRDLSVGTKVRAALAGASRLLRRCHVRLKLKGTINHFDGPPADITNETQLEAVHSVAADVKIVSKITFCRTDGSFFGCAWRPHDRPKTIIIALNKPGADILGHIVWAHEFGHTAGLPHRKNDEQALMWPCTLNPSNLNISSRECGCFKRGRGGCPTPRPDPQFTCADN
jgi:hypothetical protein